MRLATIPKVLSSESFFALHWLLAWLQRNMRQELRIPE